MRYEHEERGWFAEFEGAADMAMSEFNEMLASGLINGWAIMAGILGDNGFTDRHGEEFSLGDGEDEWLKLSHRQWRWLLDMALKAPLDEVASEKA